MEMIETQSTRHFFFPGRKSLLADLILKTKDVRYSLVEALALEKILQ